jgi:hypothetical protein
VNKKVNQEFQLQHFKNLVRYKDSLEELSCLPIHNMLKVMWMEVSTEVKLVLTDHTKKQASVDDLK